jgi:PAS domain-containing protein
MENILTENALSFADLSLRRRAGDLAVEKMVLSDKNMLQESPEATQKIVYQLQVHQIELEIQNEELRRTQCELETARQRYFNLYDLAPVGYCTLSEHGLILEANLMAAKIFDSTRFCRGIISKRINTD